MSARMETQVKASATPVSALIKTSLLQRKCACGQHTIAGGECEACGKQKLQHHLASQTEPGHVPQVVHQALGASGQPLDAATRALMEPRFNHDFSRVRARSPEAIQTNSSTQIHVSHQVPLEEGERTEKYSAEGLVMDFAGSGTCKNGGAASVCNPVKGTYGLVSNDNTCCTKGCTAAHEAVHKKDHDSWGCCKALGVAWNKKGADRAKLAGQYNDWRAKVSPITECTAYSGDVTCADALAKTKNCAGAGKDTDCCKDIADYKTKYGEEAKDQCAAAPKQAEPCPAF